MGQTPRSRKQGQSAPTARPRRSGLIDTLEPRMLLAADSETRWMITAAGGVAPPSPPLTVTENLADQNGYPRTTNPAALVLTGTASSGMFVKVNGVQATPSAVPENWSLANTNNVLALTPGINRVQVRSYDNAGEELVRKTLDIWYDDGNVQSVPAGTLSGNNTWTAAGGPYLVEGDLTIPAGSSLTIESGASVYFAYQARLIVNGKLTAQGTDYKHIRFTRNPNTSSNWANIEFRNSTQDNRLAFADIEYAASTDGGTVDQHMRVDRATVYLDHVHFTNGNRMYIDATNASLDIRKSIFPSISSAELIHYLADGGNMPAGSFAVLDANAFGPSTGYNDIIDWTGGQRPGPIARFTNNWFLGGPDDGLDMDSTDAWIEGNVFMNFHQDADRDSKSHAVSTGNDFNITAEITVVRNFFYDVDHAALIKSGAFGTFVNNTIVNVHKPNPAINATTAVINFYEVRSGQWQGRGARLEGNIIHNVSQMFEIPQPFPSGRPDAVQIFVDNSILPAGSPTSQAGAVITYGPGVKFVDDPMLVKTTNVLDPTVDFALLSASPAKGTGPQGVDMGALVPHGVTVSGEPTGITNANDVTLNVGFLYGTGTNAAGYSHYKYRVNGGGWSAETPTTTPLTLTDLADGSYVVHVIGKNDAGFWQAESQATASRPFTIDTIGPTVVNTIYRFDQPAHSVVIHFSEPVQVNLAQADPRLRNLATGDVIRGAWNPTFGVPGAVITFPDLPNGRLPEGRYELILTSAGLRDQAGNALDGDADGTPGGDYTFDLFYKEGDINHDGAVNFDDLAILAQNYNSTGNTFAQGNLDHDPAGNVNFDDLAILAQQYNTALPPPPPEPAASSADSNERSTSTTAVFSTSPPVRPPAKRATARKPTGRG